MKYLLLALLSLCAVHSNAQLVRANLITIEETSLDGITFEGFDDPTMNANGTVAVVGISDIALDDFVFVFDSIFFKGTDLTNPILDPIANSCGIDDLNNVMFMGDDQFSKEIIFKSDLGAVVREEDPAPGFSPSSVINFIYRPMMLPNGWIYFIASVDVDNNGGEDSRAMYSIDPAGNLSLVYSTDILLDGQQLSNTNGYDLDFDVSENQNFTINVVDFNTGSTLNDGGVAIDGTVVLQEGTPITANANYGNFDLVRINNQGDFIVTGDSDGPTTADEYLIVNGDIQVKEGGILDGIELTTPASINAVDLNNDGDAAFVWSTAGGQEYLFSGNVNDPSGLASSRLILKRYDSLDIDGDFEWDYYITDINAFSSYRGFELKDTNILYINVDLRDSANVIREAIIRIDPFCRPLRETIAISACYNDTLMIGNTMVTSNGTYFDTTSSIGTCTNIDRYFVDYLPQPAMGNANATICTGDSILLAGNYFSQPGTYLSVLPSVVTGCDSTVNVQIANLPLYDTQLTYELCQGDSILTAGMYQTTDGVYVDSLSSQYFCDSLVTRTVSFVTEYNTPSTYSFCQGDSLLLGGQYQYTSGIYYDTLFAQFGCDSILVQTLTVNALPNITLDDYSVDSICVDGSSISLPNATPTGGIYSGNGVSGTQFDPTLTGLMGELILTYTFTDSIGCINSAETSITVYDCYLGLDELTNHMVIYPNPSEDLFHVKMSQPVESSYRVINELGQIIINGNVSGTTLDLHLGSHEPGYYYLEIGTERFKLIKLN